ncbi:MAG: hypothetical protein JOY59_11905, partial [Candidatus Eremiobacteraeota bacterium]|nr:hypothetical protein [Candidatus Eremiobacteraeota bacterium]
MNPMRDRYRPLWRIATASSGRGSDLIEAVLRQAAEELGFSEATIFSRAEEQEREDLVSAFHVGSQSGEELDARLETIARALIEQETDDDLPTYDDGNVCACALYAGDRRHVLVFSSRRGAVRTLAEDDQTYLDLVADLCGRILQRAQFEEAMN